MAKAPTNKELAESILNGIEFEGKTLFEWVKLISKENFVEVVRCKDCAFAKNNYLVNGLCLCEKTIYDHIKGEIPRNTLMEENDYCSCGERRCEE